MKTQFQPQFMFESSGDGGGGAPAGEATGEQSEGQGTGTGGQENPNAKYLQSVNVPEELHPLFYEAFAAKDADVTKGFQEHKQFRDQWEPYSKIDGLDQIPAEEMQNLVGFWNNVVQNDDAFKGFIEQASQELGITPGMDEDAWLKAGQENGWFDGEDGEEPEDPSSQPMTRAEFEDWQRQQQGQQEQKQAAEQYQQQVESQYQDLAGQHLKNVDKETAEKIQRQVYLTAHSLLEQDPNHQDPITAAFGEVMSLRGQSLGDAVEQKLQSSHGQSLDGQPPADTAPPHTSWIEGNGQSPRDAALARLRA
jgi:hypothetical protein